MLVVSWRWAMKRKFEMDRPFWWTSAMGPVHSAIASVAPGY
jgi:hypothetical protein